MLKHETDQAVVEKFGMLMDGMSHTVRFGDTCGDVDVGPFIPLDVVPVVVDTVQMLPRSMIGVNVYGPVNPQHDFLEWHDWSEKDMFPVELPAGCGLTLMPSMRTILDMLYRCLGQPVMADEEFNTRLGWQRRRNRREADYSLASVHRPQVLCALIRTRMTATMRAPQLHDGDGMYELRDAIPASMTTRFLHVHTAGTWNLLIDNVTVVQCTPAAPVDLGIFARPAIDCGEMTGGVPEANGIHLASRKQVVLQFTGSSAAPENVRFTIRGTTLIIVRDEAFFPMAGFRYACPFTDRIRMCLP